MCTLKPHTYVTKYSSEFEIYISSSGSITVLQFHVIVSVSVIIVRRGSRCLIERIHVLSDKLWDSADICLLVETIVGRPLSIRVAVCKTLYDVTTW